MRSFRMFGARTFVLAFSLCTFAAASTLVAQQAPTPDPNPAKKTNEAPPPPKATLPLLPTLPAFEQLQRKQFPEQFTVKPAEAQNLNSAQILSRTFINLMGELHFDLYEQPKRQAYLDKWLPKVADVKTLEDADKLNEKAMEDLGHRFDYYLRPEATEEEAQESKPETVGVGVIVEQVRQHEFVDHLPPDTAPEERQKLIIVDDAHPVILHPQKNGPAAKAGVQDGDVLRKVDGKDINGMKLVDVFGLIAGKKASKVDFTVERKTLFGYGPTLEHKITIERDAFVRPVVTTRWLGNGTTYVALDDFMSFNAANEMAEALEQAAKVPNGKLVLDLRNNPGGRLDLAISIVGMMLKEGTIVRLRERNGYQMTARHYSATPDGILLTQPLSFDSSRISYSAFQRKCIIPDTMPIIILVNQYSASASELTSGALRFNNRAIIVGMPTVGKGVGQQVIPLPEKRSTHITTFFFDPAGRIIDFEGIHPDHQVDLEAAAKQLVELRAELRKQLDEQKGVKEKLTTSQAAEKAAKDKLTAAQTAEKAAKDKLTAAKDEEKAELQKQLTAAEQETATQQKAATAAEQERVGLEKQLAGVDGKLKDHREKLAQHHEMLKKNDPQVQKAKEAALVEFERMKKVREEREKLHEDTMKKKQQDWLDKKKKRDELREKQSSQKAAA